MALHSFYPMKWSPHFWAGRGIRAETLGHVNVSAPGQQLIKERSDFVYQSPVFCTVKLTDQFQGDTFGFKFREISGLRSGRNNCLLFYYRSGANGVLQESLISFVVLDVIVVGELK